MAMARSLRSTGIVHTGQFHIGTIAAAKELMPSPHCRAWESILKSVPPPDNASAAAANEIQIAGI